MANAHNIILRGDAITRREDKGGATITPGMVLAFSGGNLIPHGTSGAISRKIALEQNFVGKGVTDTFASGERVPYADCSPGTVVWAHLASGQNVSRGAALMSNGAGFLTAATSNPGTNSVIAEADEDANAATGVAAAGSLRFRARIV